MSAWIAFLGHLKGLEITTSTPNWEVDWSGTVQDSVAIDSAQWNEASKVAMILTKEDNFPRAVPYGDGTIALEWDLPSGAEFVCEVLPRYVVGDDGKRFDLGQQYMWTSHNGPLRWLSGMSNDILEVQKFFDQESNA
jgi:hypothetical protein